MNTRTDRREYMGEPPQQLSSTRLCFKNVPAQFNSANLRQFLRTHKQLGDLKITDCHVLPHHKGVAFVGLATHEQALHCLNTLDQAYCRTSKLLVEWARSKSVSAKDNNNNNDDSNTDMNDTEQDDVKLAKQEKIQQQKQEFLSVMGVNTADQQQKAAPKQFWANDDTYQPNAITTTTVDDFKGVSDSDSDDESSQSSDDSSEPAVVQNNSKNKANQSSDFAFLQSKKVNTDNLDEHAQSLQQQNQESDDSSTDSSTVDDADETTKTKQKIVKVVDATQDQTERDQLESETSSSFVPNRLFIRNLPFDTTEDDLRDLFNEYGTILECHLPVDDHKRTKGFAFVTFASAESATRALEELDGRDFQGRLVHLLPARAAPTPTPPSHFTYKEQQEWIKQQQATKNDQGWSASFVRGDAVVDNLATRLGLDKSQILNVKDKLSGGDAAVRLALAETAIIEENRQYFAQHGIDMEALVGMDSSTADKAVRSKTAVLVKNLPHDTTREELLKTFTKGGDTPTRVLLPPSRTIAVIEYAHGNDAKKAFKSLAYRRFKTVPLYLEWAPIVKVDNGNANVDEAAVSEEKTNKAVATTTKEQVDYTETEVTLGPTATLHVKNLNFSTTDDQLFEFFKQFTDQVRAARIPKKVAAAAAKDKTASRREMSMGYGFVEFASQSSAHVALEKSNGMLLDGHQLEVKPSTSADKQRSTTTNSTTANKSTKLMVRNVPFQASRSELLKLFGSFGQLKNVRVPKKFDGGHRGFAFVEYVAQAEAASAMQALSRTHLYGRHLVLEWAEADDSLQGMDNLRRKAQQDVKQSKPVNKRIKFN